MNFFRKSEYQGLVELCFDSPGKAVNVLSSEALEELSKILDELSKQSAKGLIIYSGKKNNFIAGADIEEIVSITKKEEARIKSAQGQAIFQKIAELPFPSLALIAGSCMGGGTELALACSERMIADMDKTRIALPEVNLGILPGFGGTQRLPRLIGLQASLPFLLSGKNMDARKAYKTGFAKASVTPAFLLDKGREALLSGKIKAQRSKLENPFKRKLILDYAHKTVMAKTGGHYPAPLTIIELLRKSLSLDIKTGLEKEAEYFSRIACGRVSKNCIYIFQNSELLKKSKSINNNAATREGESAVLGSGVMGGGIAWLFSSRKRSVYMRDISENMIAKGMFQANQYYKALFKRKKISQAEKINGMHRISAGTSLNPLKKSIYITEAVTESLELKEKVLSEAESLAPKDAILLTNTSSLRVDDMAKALKRPERLAGMHYFNPVNRMPLVEVVQGKATDRYVVDELVSLTRELGKIPIVVKDAPGFVVNRILLPYLNEAGLLFEEGYSIEAIDHSLKRFGMPMGPFTLLDEIGLDVAWKVAKILEEAFGSRMQVSSVLKEIFNEDKLLGKKGGSGFYTYQGKNKKPNQIMIQKRQKKKSSSSIEDARKRCLYIMVNEACRVLEEGLVSEPAHLDMAMIFGTGFPPYTGGILRWADDYGLEKINKQLIAWSEQGLSRFTPSKLLLDSAKNNRALA